MNVCIILLGADGSVIRTLPIARALYEEKKAKITWITKGDVATLLDNIPYIEKVLQIEDVEEIEEESFDELYNFDFDESALELTNEISAKKKYGFYDEAGYPVSYNSGGEYYLNTMFDDELKKKNTKTYQEMMFDIAELPLKKERFELILNKSDKNYASEFARKNNLEGKKVIGVHMGSSSKWPSKAWHPERVKEFICLAKSKGFEIILFGGPNEVDVHHKINEELRGESISVIHNDPNNTKREFVSLASLCDVIVCGDSFAVHVSLGLRKKTIALFFVTSPAEIEGYGLLTKIVSPKLVNFFPEKSDVYDEELVKSISAEEVMNEIEKIYSL